MKWRQSHTPSDSTSLAHFFPGFALGWGPRKPTGWDGATEVPGGRREGGAEQRREAHQQAGGRRRRDVADGTRVVEGRREKERERVCVA
jgi:hypothetical protein